MAMMKNICIGSRYKTLREEGVGEVGEWQLLYRGSASVVDNNNNDSNNNTRES